MAAASAIGGRETSCPVCGAAINERCLNIVTRREQIVSHAERITKRVRENLEQREAERDGES